MSWEHGDMGFRLRWEESGGPPVTVPQKQGFGTRLIGQGLSSELGGKVAMDFRAQESSASLMARFFPVRSEAEAKLAFGL